MDSEIKNCDTCKFGKQPAGNYPCDNCGTIIEYDKWQPSDMIDERDKIIEELRAQIESLKCCGNCAHIGDHRAHDFCGSCKDLSNWD